MPPRLPDDKRAAILNDVRAGGQSARQIADKHHVSASTVSKLAKDAELPDAFERSQTLKATRTKQADNRARRARITSELLDDVDRLRDRAWSNYQHPMSSPTGPEILTLDLPPLTEVRAAYTAVGICIDKSIAVERHDTDSGTDQARSMLTGLSDALDAAAKALEPADGPGEGD